MKLRGAVVGVGYLGTFHAQKYVNNPNVQLVGVCDHFAAQAQKVSSALGVQAFASPNDLIGNVDLVTVAASTQSHYELVKLYLKNKIHVNVEKPIAATVDQAKELVELAKKNNCILMVGHIERFNPAIRDLKNKITNLKLLELTRRGPFRARGADVSVLHDLMIHDIDLMYWLTNSEIDNVLVHGARIVTDTLDVGHITAQMKNGVLVSINVSRVSTQAERWVRATMQDHIIFANTANFELEKIAKGPSEEPMAITKWTLEKEDALQKETDSFIDCVMNNKKPVITGEDGLKALILVEKILSEVNTKL